MATIGVVVFCDTDGKHLDRSLQSVQWADDITVVNVRDAARTAHQRGGLREECQQTDWILHLWAGERLENKLAEDLSSLRRIPLNEARSAYEIHVRSHLLGTWIHGSIWSPSPSLRVTRERRRWPAAWWNLDASKPTQPALLPGCIEDTSVADLGSTIARINVLTGWWAEELNSRGQAPGLTTAGVRSLLVLLRLCLRASTFRSGLAGLTLSVLAAYATLLVGAKASEGRKFFGASSRQSMHNPDSPNDV
jgi:hypothetical protein